jgi:hypothetical protein
MSVRGVGEGVGDELALALDIKSVAARQAQMTAATLGRALRLVFAVRLLACIGMRIPAGIVRILPQRTNRFRVERSALQ